MMHGKDPLYSLKPDRMHEVCGPSMLSFAAAQAALARGVVFWVRETWQAEQLNPIGLTQFLPPENILTASTRNQTETLAVAEEALRAGSVSLVIMHLSGVVDLTAGRRLQLAARAGKTLGIACIQKALAVMQRKHGGIAHLFLIQRTRLSNSGNL